MSDVSQFYNDLASDYRAIFPNWNQSVLRQANSLHPLIQRLGYNTKHTIWDCTCGIGTQAFGFASKGYSVIGTDLSPKPIAQAKTYVNEFDTPIQPTFDVIDLLNPPDNVPQADIVVALDNAIAHFLDDDTLTSAISTMKRGFKADGLLLMSIRDYDDIIQRKPRTTLPSIMEDDEGKHIIFQVWDWDEDSYQLNMFITHPDGDGWKTYCYVSTLRAVQRDSVTQVLASLGFSDIHWHMPDDSGFFQPIVSAKV